MPGNKSKAKQVSRPVSPHQPMSIHQGRRVYKESELSPTSNPLTHCHDETAYDRSAYLETRDPHISAWGDDTSLALQCRGHESLQDCAKGFTSCTSGMTSVKRPASSGTPIHDDNDQAGHRCRLNSRFDCPSGTQARSGMNSGYVLSICTTRVGL